MPDEALKQAVAGLKPRAILDHRHPVMYEDSISGGVDALVRFFAALQRRDLRGMAEHMHFPHASIEGTTWS